MTLKAGAGGKARILVKGRGVNLQMPTLPLTQPVTVQLQNSTGECWDAIYSDPPIRNQVDQFRDKGD